MAHNGGASATEFQNFSITVALVDACHSACNFKPLSHNRHPLFSSKGPRAGEKGETLAPFIASSYPEASAHCLLRLNLSLRSGQNYDADKESWLFEASEVVRASQSPSLKEDYARANH